MMPETLNSQPCCSPSMNTNTHQNPFFYLGTRHDFRTHIQYFSCSAISIRGVHKTRGYGPANSSAGLRKSKKRIPESFPHPIHIKPRSFESNSFSEEGEVSVLAVHESSLARLHHEIESELYYLEERDEEVLSKRILELSRCNKVRSALSLYRSMKLSGLQPEQHACNSLLACLIRNQRIDDSLNVFNFMKSKEITTGHSYSLIFKAVAQSQGYRAALAMFHEAGRNSKTKKQMDLIVYNTMIGILGKANNWSEAERIWRIIQENGIVGSVITYRLLISVFVRCNRNELALDAYNEMVRNGITPSDDIMQAVIGACSREGKCDMALNVLQTMLDHEIKPSLVSCNALINMLAKTSKLEKAFEVYDLILSFGYTPDGYSWNGLLIALNHSGRYPDSVKLFDTISKHHKHVLNLHIYNACLVSCQRLGLWERAVKLIWEMEETGIQATVTSYNLVIGACEAGNEPMAALQVYHHMIQQKQTPNSFTLLPLIRICIWSSLWGELEKILDSTSNEILHNIAIRGLCSKKQMNLARKQYTNMCEIGLRPDGKTRALMQQNIMDL